MSEDDYCTECHKLTTWCLCDTYVVDTQENLVAIIKGMRDPEEFPRRSRRQEIEEHYLSA